MNYPSQAIILAAGLGMRMRPLTLTTPKPLLRIAGKPLIDWALDRLGEAGCTHVVVNVHHLKTLMESHLSPPRAGLQIICVPEDPILETGGGIKNALELGLLGMRPFYACNADNLWLDGTDKALIRLAAAWNDDTMDGLLLLQPLKDATGYDGAGDFWGPVDQAAPIRRRSDEGQGQAATVFTGVQLLHPRLFQEAPRGTFSLNVLYDQALAKGRLYGLSHQGAWHHVGTPEALAATDAVLRGQS